MEPVAPLGKILLYVDATESSLTAARYAIALAKTYGAELHALYVVNERILLELLRARVFVEEEEVDLERDLEEDGRRHLVFIKRLAQTKGVAVTTELRKGIIHAEVVHKAAEMDVSLIIMGEIEAPVSRRDSFYDDAEIILWTAGCPVLIVKGEALVDRFYDSA